MQFSNLKIGKFDNISQCWRVVNSNENTVTTSLKLATYNVWFSEELIDERATALLKILQECNADIIALQEVTYHFLHVTLMQEWVRKSYFISDFKDDTFSSYGVVMLSRIPIKTLSIHQLPSDMERKLLLAELIINGKILKIATVHLESIKDSVDVRAEQLKVIFHLLDNADSSVLMGDFNFCSSNKKETQNIDSSYSDLWEQIRNDELGYTLNSEINTMLSLNSSNKIMTRYDRVLFRQKQTDWRFKEIRLLGNEAISDEPKIFPSDHFGIMAEIEC